MQKAKFRIVLSVVGIAAILAMGLSLAQAEAETAKNTHSQEAEGHSHNKAQRHGGLVTMSTEKEFHFEVLFRRDSVQVYLYNGDQDPISAKGVQGTVSLAFRGGRRKTISAALAYVHPAKSAEAEPGHGHKEEKGHQEQDFLQAKIDLAKVQEGNMKAVFAMKNLRGKKEKAITFKETFKLARFVQYVCPMKDTKPADHPGKCPKCKMTLKRDAYIYSCSMHAKVTSRNSADKCWVCGMKLVTARAHHEEKKGHGEHKEDKEHDEHKETKKEAKHGH